MNELLSLIEKEKKILKTKVPIIVKISPDIKDDNINMISDLLLKHDVKAIIISNTTDKNRENLLNINKLEKRSNELINKFYKILKNKIKIIGVGGVDSGQSAYQKIINGASLVQLYTGMIYQGPNIATKISQELINILEKEGIKNISDVVGSKN